MIKNRTLSIQQSVRQVKGNIISDMDGEKVMLSIESGKYYNFGEIGGKIWDIMEESITINQLVTTLIDIYDVEQTQCEQQVLSFLEQLLKENLIELVVRYLKKVGKNYMNMVKKMNTFFYSR